MADEGEVMKLKDKPKEAFYVRFEDARIENLIESFFSELKMALEGMSDEDKIVRKEVMNFALDFVRGSNLPQREQEKIIKEVDKRSIGRVAYFLLLKRVFETIKMVEPELEKEEFYVDSEGSFVPKEWVDKKITLKSRMDWQTKVFRFPKK
jgi:hypothetical protein